MLARLAVLLLPLILVSTAWSQGFGGLGSSAEGFAVPERGTVLAFPEDHGPHPDYRIEWWYLTANLEDETGEPMGMQWTLFRSALEPGTGSAFSPRQIWFAHAAVTGENFHRAAETISREGFGTAGVMIEPFRAHINGWEMAAPNTEPLQSRSADPLDSLVVTAGDENFSYRLRLTADGPLVFHGSEGFSLKSDSGQASYYYSQPFYSVSGFIEVDGTRKPVTGRAWLDREWSSQPLDSKQSGWDWISLHLASEEKLMAFRLREDNGDFFHSGTWINRDGRTEPLPGDSLYMEPLETSTVQNRRIPTKWRVEVPERGIDIEISALNKNAWMPLSISYWEGPVTVRGSHEGKGYLEMTGYE